MKECMLCDQDMKNDKYFGRSCFKKACNILELYKVKNETELSDAILRLCNKGKLPNKQAMLVVDRYLTLNILNHVPIQTYSKYKKAVDEDINKINNKSTKNSLESFSLISLKQAVTINKMYEKYKDFFDKIMNGDYDKIQNISFDLVNFAFSRYYSKKEYLYDGIQLLQFGILKRSSILFK